MVLRLDNEDIMDRFLWLLYPSFTFDLIKPKVEHDGLGSHGDYHLMIAADTELKDTIGFFPSFPYEIWTTAQLTTFAMTNDYLFGLFFSLYYTQNNKVSAFTFYSLYYKN